MKLKSSWPILMILFTWHVSVGQKPEFQYQRSIEPPSEEWHTIDIPSEIYQRVGRGLEDIRIYSIQENGDTTEVPFFIEQSASRVEERAVSFELLNQSRQDAKWFFTFETKSKDDINQIDLVFSEQNFDRVVKLEGSQNQSGWFELGNDFRIVSIQNSQVDYAYTSIKFEASRYNFYRLSFNSEVTPNLEKATLNQTVVHSGAARTYPQKSLSETNNSEERTTQIDIDLKYSVPVNYLTFNVQESSDYYRPFEVLVLADSTETEKGWKYRYQTLVQGHLSSVESNQFNTREVLAKKLRVVIYNYDNRPLNVESVQISGWERSLTARFENPSAENFLMYGNPKVIAPQYDIAYFKDKKPDGISRLNLGDEVVLNPDFLSEKAKDDSGGPSRVWLWAVMILVIGVLGWFSFKLLKST